MLTGGRQKSRYRESWAGVRRAACAGGSLCVQVAAPAHRARAALPPPRRPQRAEAAGQRTQRQVSSAHTTPTHTTLFHLLPPCGEVQLQLIKLYDLYCTGLWTLLSSLYKLIIKIIVKMLVQ